MARERAVRLAAGMGRSAQEVSKSDWELANQELRGDTSGKSKVTRSGSVNDSEQWDALPSSGGYRVHVPSGDDEDDDGRSDTERLVERGIKEAGDDRVREANREGELE